MPKYNEHNDWGGELEDWSDSFDDMGSDFWEDHYDKFNREEDYSLMEMEALNSELYENENLSGQQGQRPTVTPRQKEIVQWLLSSKFAVTMENNRGFYVSGQRKGKLKDGRIFKIINWLYREGIKSGGKILQYKLQYNRKEQRLFFLIK